MMDNAEDHVVVNNTAARVADEEDLFNKEDERGDLFNGGARENPAQRDEDINPCFYRALSERTPAQVKVKTILTCRRLCTLNV
jgi:hypothetical protein